MGNAILVVLYMVIVNFFVNNKSSFLMELLKMLSFGFHEPEFRGEPVGREEETDLVYNGARKSRIQ